jgi:hypothetical protein
VAVFVRAGLDTNSCYRPVLGDKAPPSGDTAVLLHTCTEKDIGGGKASLVLIRALTEIRNPLMVWGDLEQARSVGLFAARLTVDAILGRCLATTPPISNYLPNSSECIYTAASASMLCGSCSPSATVNAALLSRKRPEFVMECVSL